MTKIRLRVLNSGYVLTVNVAIMHTNFQMKLQVLLKVMVQLAYYWSK